MDLQQWRYPLAEKEDFMNPGSGDQEAAEQAAAEKAAGESC